MICFPSMCKFKGEKKHDRNKRKRRVSFGQGNICLCLLSYCVCVCSITINSVFKVTSIWHSNNINTAPALTSLIALTWSVLMGSVFHGMSDAAQRLLILCFIRRDIIWVTCSLLKPPDRGSDELKKQAAVLTCDLCCFISVGAWSLKCCIIK